MKSNLSNSEVEISLTNIWIKLRTGLEKTGVGAGRRCRWLVTGLHNTVLVLVLVVIGLSQYGAGDWAS